ncbi:hypothetical protein NL676_010309 [Syzygium grande]|nr:hypothetical protein NL676_010309 [Syzygium grande]
MASPLALRRALASAVSSSKLASPVRSASVAPFLTPARSFNTDAQMTRVDGDGSKAVDVDRTAPDRSVSRRRDRSVAPFSDVFDPLFPPRSLSQVLNLMDQLMEDPFQAILRRRVEERVGREGGRQGPQAPDRHARAEQGGREGGGGAEHPDHRGEGGEPEAGEEEEGERTEVFRQDRPAPKPVQDGRDKGGDEERSAEGGGAQSAGRREEGCVGGSGGVKAASGKTGLDPVKSRRALNSETLHTSHSISSEACTQNRSATLSHTTRICMRFRTHHHPQSQTTSVVNRVDKINAILKITEKNKEETKTGQFLNDISILIVGVVPLLGLPISLFDVLGDEKASPRELLDVGHVVVLRHVDAEGRPHEEREAAPDQSHLLRGSSSRISPQGNRERFSIARRQAKGRRELPVRRDTGGRVAAAAAAAASDPTEESDAEGGFLWWVATCCPRDSLRLT